MLSTICSLVETNDEAQSNKVAQSRNSVWLSSEIGNSVHSKGNFDACNMQEARLDARGLYDPLVGSLQ